MWVFNLFRFFWVYRFLCSYVCQKLNINKVIQKIQAKLETQKNILLKKTHSANKQKTKSEK